MRVKITVVNMSSKPHQIATTIQDPDVSYGETRDLALKSVSLRDGDVYAWFEEPWYRGEIPQGVVGFFCRGYIYRYFGKKPHTGMKGAWYYRHQRVWRTPPEFPFHKKMVNVVRTNA